MLIPANVTRSIEQAADFPGGPSFHTITNAIGLALPSWIGSGVVINGLTTGLTGAGTVTGTMIFLGNTPDVLLSLENGGVGGSQANRFARALALGITEALMGTTYTGVSAGVSSGTDISLVASVNVTTLASTLEATHRSLCTPLGGLGSQAPGFYQALADGIASILRTGATIPGTGVVAPSGSTGPLPGVGTSVSSIV